MVSRFWSWLFRSQTLQFLLIVLLIVLAVVFVAVLVSKSLEACVLKSLGLEEDAKYEALKFLGIGMGGVLIALQALMSYRRAKAMEKTAKSQADAVLKTEQGQQQERFRNAIEHLGHEKVSVRLGGAYELFHLAQDIEDLRQTVLDVLCAHIRQTTGECEYQKKHKVPEDVEYVSTKPSEEVQSLLNLLFVQEHDVFKGLSADLRGSWMSGADLRIARLESAVLVGVDLQEANLTRANLQGVNLDGARLQGANLEGANLQRANVTWTHLERTNLKETKLQGADLTRAKLQGADLKGASLQGVNLTRAKLQGADLKGANLQGVDLKGANLQEANLQRVKLQGVVLWAAELQGVDLTKAQLQAANLWAAKLQEANLTEAQLQGVISKKNCLISFEKRIRTQTGKESDLSGITFEGGLGQNTLDCIVEDYQGLLTEETRKLREKLTRHLDKPKSNKLPKNSGAITGTYTREDAEKWIAEYNEAMSSVPKEDTTNRPF